jgi:hypothetical protein
MLNSDLNIFYLGASGGFYFLHYLLLYGQHAVSFPTDPARFLAEETQENIQALRLSRSCYQQCRGADWPDYQDYLDKFNSLPRELHNELAQLHQVSAFNVTDFPGWFDRRLDEVVEHNWDIKDHTKWKQNEVWPINADTLASRCSDRPFKIFFTCNIIDDWLKYPGKKVVLYTDIETQLALAKYKQAWVYAGGRDPSDSQLLQLMQRAVDYQDRRVYHELAAVLPQADHVVYLQDFIQDPDTLTRGKSTLAHHQLQQRWLNNHAGGVFQLT